MKKIHTNWLLLVAGALWLILGTVGFFSATVTYLVIVKYSGVALLLDGLLLLILSIIDGHPKERNWRISESLIDITFSFFLLLDPVFSLFAFPFIVTPWMAAKGLIKMIGSLALAKYIYRWSGDFLGGILLMVFSMLIHHDPIEVPYSIGMLVGALGWTLGLIYCYDYYREAGPPSSPSQRSPTPNTTPSPPGTKAPSKRSPSRFGPGPSP